MPAFSHFDRPKTSSTAPGNYAFLNNKWGAPSLGTTPVFPITYSLTPILGTDYIDPTPITDPDHIAAVDRAFATWASVSNLQFTKEADGIDADIDLFFDPIDGASNNLAIARNTFTSTGRVMEMTLNVEIEFDVFDLANADAEVFYVIALHEIGHGLGLDHVDDPDQIMYDFYTSENSDLGVGDIAGIEALYGAPSGSGFGFGNAISEDIDTSTDSTDTEVYGAGGDDTLTTGAGDDTLVGGIGDDISVGNDGRDMLFDPFGNDILQGDAGEDNLYSPEGANLLDGGADDDALRGGIGNDTLMGGSGNDALIGDEQTSSSLWFGDDLLEGGSGDDLLEGGSGRDVFVFSPDDGNDKIGKISFNSDTGFSVLSDQVDFEVGIDKLDVSAFNFGSAEQALGKLTSTPEGVAFEANNTSVTLIGVNIDALSASDFLWA